MSVHFACPECGYDLKVNERAVGRRVRCPDCAALVVVPDTASDRNATDVTDELEVFAEDPAAGGPEANEDILQPISPPVAPPVLQMPQRPKRRPLRAAEPPTEPPHATADEPLQLPPPRRHADDLIDMTAMVDIVFFLLIFFLVTSLQSLEAVMDLPTPQAAEGGASSGRSVAELENDPNFITVRIEEDDSIWVEDTQVFNDQELSLRLRAARLAGDNPRSLLVIGDPDASHGAAVRVFDAGAGAGVNGISLLVQEAAGP